MHWTCLNIFWLHLSHAWCQPERNAFKPLLHDFTNATVSFIGLSICTIHTPYHNEIQLLCTFNWFNNSQNGGFCTWLISKASTFCNDNNYNLQITKGFHVMSAMLQQMHRASIQAEWNVTNIKHGKKSMYKYQERKGENNHYIHDGQVINSIIHLP